MKESGLKNVRNKYNRIKNEQETLKSYKNELEELAKDVKVKRFVEHTINSNFIMVFMGSYIKKSSENQSPMKETQMLVIGYIWIWKQQNAIRLIKINV